MDTTDAAPAATTDAVERPDNLYAYLLLRTDMPSLGRGKGDAHAMHAGNDMTYRTMVRPLMAGTPVDPRVTAWHAQGATFGTTITLGSTGEITKDVLLSIVEAAEPLGFHAGLVCDTSYPFFMNAEDGQFVDRSILTREPKRVKGGWMLCREEITAAWIMGDKDDLSILLARFDLAPND